LKTSYVAQQPNGTKISVDAFLYFGKKKKITAKLDLGSATGRSFRCTFYVFLFFIYVIIPKNLTNSSANIFANFIEMCKVVRVVSRVESIHQRDFALFNSTAIISMDIKKLQRIIPVIKYIFC
jgi:hypothetical protein